MSQAQRDYAQTMDLLWMAYLSGQYGKETLEWHKRNTPGFSDYVRRRLADICGEDAKQEKDGFYG